MLQELEGFTYAMALDLNMGYYTISLDLNVSRICTIIFPWEKYPYKRQPMGIAGSPDIFQEKMSNLMATLEFVRTYFDDLLIITKGNLEDHLEKLSMVLTRLQDASLKINTDDLNFCTLEMDYLGYILTRDGIKLQSNKVQAMLAQALLRNVKELRRFLGMVQYYRDLWARRSNMLAPLTSLVGELSCTCCQHVADMSPTHDKVVQIWPTGQCPDADIISSLAIPAHFYVGKWQHFIVMQKYYTI